MISAIVWLLVGIILILFFLIYIFLWFLSLPFDRKKYFVQKLTQLWIDFYIIVFPFWTINVIDKHKIIKGRPCIAVSNHQSLLDIAILFHVYAYFVWVSKIENFHIPIIGWVMSLNHFVSLDRNDPKTFHKMFEDISKAIKSNKTVMMFPEGTRSKNYELGRFKEGAFKAAIENKSPILPIVLDGTGNAIPKEGMLISRKTKVTIKVLDSIPYEKFPSYEPSILKEHVKAIIAKELENIRKSAL
jgi:1-acyl-sn-glycerol-3-phosphate acyltransferase